MVKSYYFLISLHGLSRLNLCLFLCEGNHYFLKLNSNQPKIIPKNNKSPVAPIRSQFSKCSNFNENWHYGQLNDAYLNMIQMYQERLRTQCYKTYNNKSLNIHQCSSSFFLGKAKVRLYQKTGQWRQFWTNSYNFKRWLVYLCKDQM